MNTVHYNLNMHNSRITKIKTPAKGKVDHYFVASDWHTDALHLPTWNILRAHASSVPKARRKLIINGDFLDCVHLMGKPGELRQMAKSVLTVEYLVEESEYEFEWGKKTLDEAQKTFSEVIFLMGNHDYRYDLWRRDYCPHEYKHNFDFSRRLGLKERGIQLIEYPDYLDIGHLTITHGFKHSRTHNKTMMDVIGRSCLYGHVHHFNCTSYDVRGESKRATSQPCMSTLGPEYQRKRGENNWSNGYAEVCMRSDGLFNLYILEPWKDQLILPGGRVING